MEDIDNLLQRMVKARDTLMDEAVKASDIGLTLHLAIVEAGAVLEDALATLTYLKAELEQRTDSGE
jgi:hypothetical protein